MKLIDITHDVAKKFLLNKGVRKYSLVLISMGFLIAGFLVTGYFTSTAAQFTTFVGGIITLYAIYSGGNVASKFSPTSSTDEIKPPEEPQE